VSDLLDLYDSLIVDADGVIYRGSMAVDHAIEALRSAGDRVPWCVLTNNAASPPSVVADRISGLGLALDPSNVVTSPQGAVAYLQGRGLAPGSPILVVGGPGIDDAVIAGGFVPVRDRSRQPAAVVQGLGKDVGWHELSEAAYAIAAGATWVATNLDPSLPTEEGFAIGNGALVGAVQIATGKDPDAVTGKPEPLLFHLATTRMGAQRPLVIGDRPDTDILGAHRSGLDSLLVLTGVTGRQGLIELFDIDPQFRPTYLAADLRALADPAEQVRIDAEAPGSGVLSDVRRLLGQAWGDPSAADQLRPTFRAALDAWLAHQN
jgi:glycerol 3-phosphatase-2